MSTDQANEAPDMDVSRSIDSDMLAAVTAVVERAGERLVAGFRTRTGLVTRAAVEDAIVAADAASLAVLRPGLEAARPGAGWVDDELGEGPLPNGEWWVADPVEGAINYVHGLTDWGVTATLVSDNRPVLTVIRLPLAPATYQALKGHGAWRNGERVRTSDKIELRGALVGTGQASPHETTSTFRLISRSLAAMMEVSGVTRVSVPSTLQLTTVAAGQWDVFWQHSAVASGLLAGALLVAEAGGVVTDIAGEAWTLHSTDFLAAAPGVHAQAVTVLTGIRSDGPRLPRRN
jgi:myo-inositol-1(or 4)-monophosphatase